MKQKCILSFFVCLVMLIPAANAGSDDKEVTIKEVPAKTVLYSVAKGHYSQIGESISKLYCLADEKQIKHTGRLSFVYLNNPNEVPPEDWLVEIHITVDDEEIEKSGTLGDDADIKSIPDMQVAVINRDSIMADPTALYERLYSWISTEGYQPVGCPFEIFPDIKRDSNYGQIKTEIMVPVKEATK